MGGKESASCFVSLGRSSQKLSPLLQRGPAGSQESSDYSSPDGKIGQVGWVGMEEPQRSAIDDDLSRMHGEAIYPVMIPRRFSVP